MTRDPVSAARDVLRDRLQTAEGTGPIVHDRLMPYYDCCGRPPEFCTGRPPDVTLQPGQHARGLLTIGFGRCLQRVGITRLEADLMLERDIDDAVKAAARLGQWFTDLDPVRQAVIVEMIFNMGWAKFNQFHRMLAAMIDGDVELAAVEMLDSAWAVDVKGRALALAEAYRVGHWPATA